MHVYGQNPDRGAREKTGASTFTSIVEDGKLSFLLYLHDYKNLNKSYVTISLKNLELYHDLGMTEDEADENQAVKKVTDRQKELSSINLEEIHLKDGRVISVDGTSGLGTRDGIWLEGYWDMNLIGEALAPEDVESITVAGKKIVL